MSNALNSQADPITTTHCYGWSQRLKFRNWSIWEQLFSITIILGMMFAWGGGIFIKDLETRQVLRQAERKSVQVTQLLTNYSEVLLAYDQGEIDVRSLQNAASQIDDLFAFEILDDSDVKLVAWRASWPIAKEYCLEFEHRLAGPNDKYYTMKLKWNFKAPLVELEKNLLKKQAFIFIFTLLASSIILFFIHRLAITPLNMIHKKIHDITNGNHVGEGATSFSRSKEITELNHSIQFLSSALRERYVREATVKAVVESALDCIVIANEEGEIIEFNPAAEKTFGFLREDILGRNLTETIIPEEYRAMHEAGLRCYKETGIAEVIGQRIEISALHATGSVFPVELAVEAADGIQGPIFVAYMRDITDRKNYEERLEEARTHAEQANAAKSEFLAMMSHEIRTPLNGVIGVLGLLNESPMNSEQKKFVKTGRVSAETLLCVINDVLDFSKMEAGKLEIEPEVFDIHGLVEDVADIIRPRGSARKLDLLVEIDVDIPRWIEGDSGRTRQVLINLVGNAVKFTQEGYVKISLKKNRKQLMLSVEDTGIGIPAHKHSELFLEFSMLDASYSRKFGGTGLGLVISRKLAELMNGSLEFESEEGHGSAFTLTIPLICAEIPSEETMEGAEKYSLDDFRGKRILVAEDNPANVIVAKAMLENMGFVVDVASDGTEAVEAVRHFPYDLVFMDIAMPEMDGISATKVIRNMVNDEGQQSMKNLPIVAMTAHAMTGYRQKVLEAGMDDYISKPVRKKHLLKVLLGYFPDPKASNHGTLSVVAVEKINVRTASPMNDKNEIFDLRVINNLAADVGPDIIPELAEIFLTDSARRMVNITRAIETEDMAVLDEESHTLGSSAAAYGTIALHNCLRDIEVYILDGQKEAAIERAKESLPIYEQSKEAVEEYLESLK